MRTEKEIRARMLLCEEKAASYRNRLRLQPDDASYYATAVAYSKEAQVLAWVLGEVGK